MKSLKQICCLFTTTNMLKFAQSKPAKEKWIFLDAKNCFLTQMGKSLGADETFYHCGLDAVRMNGESGTIPNSAVTLLRRYRSTDKPLTFGGAARYFKKVLAKKSRQSAK